MGFKYVFQCLWLHLNVYDQASSYRKEEKERKFPKSPMSMQIYLKALLRQSNQIVLAKQRCFSTKLSISYSSLAYATATSNPRSNYRQIKQAVT